MNLSPAITADLHGADLDLDADVLFAGSHLTSLDLDVDALMAGSHFATMDASTRRALEDLDLEVSVDDLVGAGLLGRMGALRA